MYRIGEFSKMSKTTIKALRYYDEVGLLAPEFTDPFTGYRFYTTTQLIQLHRISALRQAGLSIDEIRCILSGIPARPILEQRGSEIRSQLAELQSQLSHIKFMLQNKEEEIFMNYAATIKELPECIVYSKKFTVPNYDAYFEVVPAIGAAVAKEYPDLQCAVPEYCFIVYLDGEYKDHDINVELCEAVTQMKPDFDDIQFKKIEPVTAVSVMHKGDYADLRNAYAFAFQWIEENGYTVSDFCRESYIDGIWNKESKDDWLTELQIPVVKK